MLQHTVSSLDDVDEKYRDLYTETSSGFEVQVKGVAEMKRAKDREKEARFSAEERLKDAEAEREALQAKLDELDNKAHDGHRDNGDLEALEKSYQLKFEKLEKQFKSELEKSQQQVSGLEDWAKDQVVRSMAKDLAVEGSEGLLEPHIRPRIGLERLDGKFSPVVLDAEGKPSALTMTELMTEISDNPAYAPVIVGSKGSGSGATQSNGGSAAPTMKRQDFDALSPQARMEHFKAGGTLTD